MSLRPTTVLGATLALVLAVGTACLQQQPVSSSKAIGEQSEVIPTSAAPSPEQRARAEFASQRDLHLFGQGDLSQGVSFEGRAATDIQQHTSPAEGADFDPDIDPTGERFVFASTRHSRHSHLYTKSVGGAVITQITDGTANDAQPQYSPNGQRVAFVSDRGGSWDIWVIDANGKNAEQITRSPMPELHPSWSPDGQHLVYCRLNTGEDRGELWIVDLANPGVKRFIGEGLFPDWSPKGDKIVYQRARARGSRWFSIWTLEFKNDEVLYPTEVANSPHGAFISPTWSADGTQIAFSAVIADEQAASGRTQLQLTGKGRADIVIVDEDGVGLQRLTDGSGENYGPTWSPDGRIYFTAKLEASETIWSIKPFHPAMMNEPTIKTGTRRAAQVSDPEVEP